MPSAREQRIPVDVLTASGRGAPSLAEKLALVSDLRRNPSLGQKIDAMFIEQNTRMRKELLAAQTNLQQLEAALGQLTTPPLHPAFYLGPGPEGTGAGALVAHGDTRRLVPLAESVDPAALSVGDEVLLNQDLTAVAARMSVAGPAYGETAFVERLLDDDRMLVRIHDEQVVVGMVAVLKTETWEHGDLVRWDRAARLAFEKIQRADLDEFMLEAVPDITPQCVGGQRAILDELILTVTFALTRPDLAKDYELEGQRVVLLVGPPGTGKTLMARVVASEVRKHSGRECRICIIKPGMFEDPYVGVTQRRIRECFAAARRCEDFVLLFLDEIETIGRARGGAANHHRDVFLGALLAEIQGFDDGANDNIAIVAATNRLDLLDPALVERMELQLHVGRPDPRGAREIFSIHLSESLPYSPNRKQAAQTRNEVIERAVSSFYSPNADNAICTIKFADGKERLVTAREVASGRCFEQVCRGVRRQAAFRELRGGDPGVRVGDLDEAVAETFEKLAKTLTLRNVHGYLSDLPQDRDVVSVTPATRRVSRPHRYLRESP